jgi:arylsulfatase A-like enzyme
MWPFHPTAKDFPDLPLMEGNEVIESNPDMNQLTTRYTEYAVRFITEHKDKPFFLYLAHSMPHVPLGVSEKFRGKSAQGIYGDVIMEIDWSVGEILRALKEGGIDEKTMVIFTSDNGPWLSYGNHAGSAGPLREGKGPTWEGGHRVPCIVRWPGRIPANQVTDKMIANFDFFPTVAEAAGTTVSADRIIDGKSLWPLLEGKPGAGTPHEYFYYYGRSELQAVRKGPWKLHLPHVYRSLDVAQGADGLPAEYIQREIPLALYNLSEDIGEQHDQAAGSREVVRELQAAADAFKAAMAAESRPAGRVVMPPAPPETASSEAARVEANSSP